MGILLICIFIGIVIFMCVFMNCRFSAYSRVNSFKESLKECKAAIFVVPFVMILIWATFYIIVMSISYSSYLEDRAYIDGLIAQYRGAVEMFENKATVKLSEISNEALTDFKYSGFQQKIAELIVDLRKGISKYNKSIVQKRTMKNNFFLSWYIVQPDPDMVVINIIDK